jgi:hypothetical protein
MSLERKLTIFSLFFQLRGLWCPSMTSYPPPNRKHRFQETCPHLDQLSPWSGQPWRMRWFKPTIAAAPHAAPSGWHSKIAWMLLAVQRLLRTQTTACKCWHLKQCCWWPGAWRPPGANRPPHSHSFVALSVATVRARGDSVLPTKQQNYTLTYNLHCQKLHIFSNGLATTRLLEFYIYAACKHAVRHNRTAGPEHPYNRQVI